MRHFIITAATGLAVACLAGGCAASVQQPPAVFGNVTQGPVTSTSVSVDTTTGAAGNDGLSSSQLNAAITAATAQATAVHVTGTVTSYGGVLTLDEHLKRNGPSSGTLVFEGASIPFVTTDSVDYFQLTASFMTLVKLNDSAVRGMWVTSASSYGQSAVTLFSTFITLKSFLSHGLAGNGDTFVYTGPGQLDSQNVAMYQDQGNTGLKFDYDFPAVGAALALRASGGDSDNGLDLDFTWNQQTTAVAVPPASEIYTG